jgi:hypothetical protein
MSISTEVQAVIFSDEFEAHHDYIADGVKGTGWDGFLGLNPGETVDALNASIDRARQLYMESTGAFYHEPWDPLGPFLYKIIEGDFIASVKVSDYAGTPAAVVYHNNCGLLARAKPNDAGPGEDWVAIDYFPIWSCGNFVRTADNGVRTENGHNGAQWDLDPYLQLERRGNTFHFRTSADGITWTEMDVSPITRDDFDGLPLQVGLYQATYSSDTGYVAFDDFRVGPRVKAYNPAPADGAIHPDTWVSLSWSPGGFAISHNVYFDDNFEDVNAGSPDAFRGNQALPYFVVGFPGFPYPEGLVPGTTYYWRIDEVNSVNPDSPWAGNVWSFTTGDFFVIDDFEDYDAGENQIWYAWHDGLGYGVPGTDPYYADNGTGAVVGDETSTSYTEETIVHGGSKSMPVYYDNNKQSYAYYSEVEHALTNQRDWTEQGVTELSIWFRGYPASVGSFVEGPVGTFTITGSGADIWDLGGLGEGYHDEFHFAYKTLSGSGSIVAKVESVENTNAWAKAGVMIRDTLNGDSKHAMMVVTPASGVSFQRRPETGGTSAADTTAGITAPYWVKIERTLAGNFIAYSSANGSTWQMLGEAEPIQMGSNVYIGLAVTAHSAGAICRAVFSNVMTTGSVGAQWTNQDIGILSNDAEPLYVAVANSAGNPVVVVHDDPDAALVDTWTEWVIPLQTFADQGINLSDVDKIAIGLGTIGNMTMPGSAGKMYIDDIRLYRSRAAGQ